MENFLKRVAFLGLGTATATKEKIEAGVQKLVKKGEITATQGRQLAKNLWADAERHSKEIKKRVNDGIKEGMAKADVARISDVEALKRRIAQLEKKLAGHERRASHTPKKKTAPAAKKATSSGKKTAKKGTAQKPALKK